MLEPQKPIVGIGTILRDDNNRYRVLAIKNKCVVLESLVDSARIVESCFVSVEGMGIENG
jgi:hypothetical protein